MTTKDLLQSIKSNLERESLFDDSETLVQIRPNGRTGNATVVASVEGKERVFEVVVRDLGLFESVKIQA